MDTNRNALEPIESGQSAWEGAVAEHEKAYTRLLGIVGRVEKGVAPVLRPSETEGSEIVSAVRPSSSQVVACINLWTEQLDTVAARLEDLVNQLDT